MTLIENIRAAVVEKIGLKEIRPLQDAMEDVTNVDSNAVKRIQIRRIIIHARVETILTVRRTHRMIFVSVPARHISVVVGVTVLMDMRATINASSVTLPNG